MIAPNEPVGNGTLASWLRKLLRYVRSCEIKSGVTYRVRRTTTGTILEIEPGGGASGATIDVAVCDPDTGATKYYRIVGRDVTDEYES